MNINEYLSKTLNPHKIGEVHYQANRPRIQCADGFSVSVQASECHYSRPRENGSHEYWAVECGFPSADVAEWNEYAEEHERHTETVFGYVPVELVDQVLESHGGIVFQGANQ